MHAGEDLGQLAGDSLERGRGPGGVRVIVHRLAEGGPVDEPVVACVSPANVPSLRALLSAGFDPVGSVQVYLPDR